jgi:hypothetical protein
VFKYLNFPGFRSPCAQDNQQCTCRAHSTSMNTVYYSLFKSSAIREWVQRREMQQSYSSGDGALHFTLHFIGNLCILVTSWAAQPTRTHSVGGANGNVCKPVVTRASLHVNCKSQIDFRALNLLTLDFVSPMTSRLLVKSHFSALVSRLFGIFPRTTCITG